MGKLGDKEGKEGVEGKGRKDTDDKKKERGKGEVVKKCEEKKILSGRWRHICEVTSCTL